MGAKIDAPARPVSLQEAISHGIRANPQLLEAFSTIQQYEWQLIAAQRQWYPTLQLTNGTPFAGIQWRPFSQTYATASSVRTSSPSPSQLTSLQPGYNISCHAIDPTNQPKNSHTQPNHNPRQRVPTLPRTDNIDTPVLLGGDLQAPSTPRQSFYEPLADFLTNTSLIHAGDPLVPTFTPTNSPLDHWLIRIPTKYPPLTTTITAIPTEYSDHHALYLEIPQQGEPNPQTSPATQIPTTRDHPPFILPIPKPPIDLYQLGNDNTRSSIPKTLDTVHHLYTISQVTP